MEDGEEEEMKEEKEEEEEEEKSEKVVQLWSPEKPRRDYITSDPSATCSPSGKVTGPEGHVSSGSEYDPDDYVSGVKLGDACLECNVSGADVDWYQHDLHEGIGICMPCMDNTELGRNLLLQLKIELEERQNNQ